MASSGGHLFHLVAKNMKILRTAWKKSSAQLLQSLRPAHSELQVAYARNLQRHPLHPIAFLRQSKGRSYATRAIHVVRQYATGQTRSYSQYRQSILSTSRVVSAVTRSPGRTPFATTLRPNLTGGCLGRTASGYSLGAGRIGGARYFSHGPATTNEVIQNVSQAVRAFCLSGHRAQYSGTNRHGEKRFDVISTLQHMTIAKLASLPKTTPGSFVEFAINPTITALAPINAVADYRACPSPVNTLKSQGLLDVLSTDFSRALKDLAAIFSDLNRLSELGDLPISCHGSSSLRVHFPGCDAHTVENLCTEIGVKRGIVFQDEDFEIFTGAEIALLFPFAPEAVLEDWEIQSSAFNAHTGVIPANGHTDWLRSMCSNKSADSVKSDDSDLVDHSSGVTHLSPVTFGSLEEFGSVRSQDFHSDVVSDCTPFEYDDFEGIFRFIELCDSARRR